MTEGAISVFALASIGKRPPHTKMTRYIKNPLLVALKISQFIITPRSSTSRRKQHEQASPIKTQGIAEMSSPQIAKTYIA